MRDPDERTVAEIRRLTEERGTPPTVREMAAALAVSPTRVGELLRRARSRGLVTWEPGHARTVRAT